MKRQTVKQDPAPLWWCVTALLALSAGCGESLPDAEPESPRPLKVAQGRLAAGLEVQGVAAGAYHSLAVKNDGVVWSWGQNTDGQLGQGTASASPQPTPLPITLPRRMTAVAAGSGHSLALDETGHVWAWGRNDKGQAGGLPANARVLAPTQVPALSGITAISARADLSLAVDANGDLWAWGQNTDGELGQGMADTAAHAVPVKVVVPALAAGDAYLPAGPTANPQDIYKFTKVAAGGHHVLALTRSGRVWSWGRNASSQVGTNEATEAPVLTPTLLRFESLVADIAAGEHHSLLVDTGDRKPWAWGLNTSGQASRTWNGLDQPVTPFPTYPQGWTFMGSAIAAGDAFSLFIGAPNVGQIRAWGDNVFGQVGDGSGLRQPEPVAVRQYKEPYGLADTEYMLAISAGARHALAVHNGCPAIWAWGDNSQGQLGLPGGVSAPVLYAQRSLPLRRFYRDTDGDGFGDPVQFEQVCEPSEGFVEGIDCDDTRPGIHPAATEVCDGLDNNCDGAVDDNGCAVWYRDADGDGYGNPSDTKQSGIQPQGYVATGTDCDDTRANVAPGKAEACDGLDNNCNAQVDEGVGSTWYRDADGDGHGNSSQSTVACSQPSGYVSNASDCNDTNGSIRPEAPEVCDGQDNNCNGQADEGVSALWYRDADGDGYGNPGNSAAACGQPSGYVANSSDCNDANGSIRPGAAEACDGVDNNCNGAVDEGTGSTWYYDGDGDGYGTSQSTRACSRPSGYAGNSGDCNDSNPNIRPGATEVCDNVDNNCNGSVDDGVGPTWYYDSDKDGYGWIITAQACTAPPGYIARGGDCNDFNASMYPGATEVCDGLDNNCNGAVDDGVGPTWYLDYDSDGYGGSQSRRACSQPSGYVANSSDCDDFSSVVWPGAPEVCDWQDNNCNGLSDEGLGAWYADGDGDGYGNPLGLAYNCIQPSGYVANASDCDDSNPAIHPGRAEVCDSLDNNCNGASDEGGVCAPVCPSDETACGNLCVDLSSDFNNCGSCGRRCSNYKFECRQGSCVQY
ncbi:hypothetical protein D7V80_09945 [Corallococcus sp. CA054B]|uniref:MopE-related protein n=1 Tax=Corallococcus sp. CA054B TaxID=2316734 RepID=UPI000EA03D56|nr:MopE-related protein [Corallococcus sp. CA054B]RKG69114.1 hypothetical protein D7V80_09945 [Corallococcus sp. CA054B]